MTLSVSALQCPTQDEDVELFNSFNKKKKSLVASNNLASFPSQDDSNFEVFLSFSDCFVYFAF